MKVRPMQIQRLAASLAASCGAAALMLAAGAVQAADPIGRAGIQAQYEEEAAACKRDGAGQARAVCLREAGAARQEANRQRLSDGDSEQHQRNLLERCNRLPAGSRQDCITQMTAPTQVYGSVQGGGVLRETVIPAPADGMPPSAPGMAPAPMPQ